MRPCELERNNARGRWGESEWLRIPGGLVAAGSKRHSSPKVDRRQTHAYCIWKVDPFPTLHSVTGNRSGMASEVCNLGERRTGICDADFVMEEARIILQSASWIVATRPRATTMDRYLAILSLFREAFRSRLTSSRHVVMH